MSVYRLCEDCGEIPAEFEEGMECPCCGHDVFLELVPLERLAAAEARVKEMEEQAAIARERLGPAGWRLLLRLKHLERVAEAAREFLDCKDLNGEWLLLRARLSNALAALDQKEGG